MEMYTPQEVADILKVKKNTVWAWLRNGELKGLRIGNKLWRITQEQLERFIENVN